MTGETWLRALAAELGVPVPTEQETTDLLALASTAAHASERVAAPLSCWLAARAGVTPAEALAVATRLAERTGDPD
jgi:imidazolonepropionase-like amidohydrolase